MKLNSSLLNSSVYKNQIEFASLTYVINDVFKFFNKKTINNIHIFTSKYELYMRNRYFNRVNNLKSEFTQFNPEITF